MIIISNMKIYFSILMISASNFVSGVSISNLACQYKLK